MSTEGRIWIIDDDKSIRWVLEKALSKAGIETRSFCDANNVMDALAEDQPDAIISDIRMPGMSGLELLEQIHLHYPELPVIITTAHSDLDSAVASYQGGAFEYLPKPFDTDEAIATAERAVSVAREQRNKTQQASAGQAGIIGEAPAMQEVFRAIGRLSRSHMTVLINGESGTGKELVAQALHNHSPRAGKPFIALNMAAIPKDLIESELFGHEKGAFTGANNHRAGRFEQANGGTLFLDEIGDMPADAQTRLLRVLADGQFYRIGGHSPVNVDVRIIAATHQNLQELVTQKLFREDLFHRLNVIRIQLPRLRDRREDIPMLIQHFLGKAASELDVESKIVLPETEAYLCQLPWKGNVRQLENICRWLTVMASGREIQINDLPEDLQSGEQEESSGAMPTLAGEQYQHWEQMLEQWIDDQIAAGQGNVLYTALPTFERTMIRCALRHTNGRKRDAAELLGWGRNTLTRKLAELDIVT